LQCIDLLSDETTPQWVCLKVIKNSKDFFDQSLDEIKLLQYINAHGDADEHNVLKLVDFFYCKEHLFIVSELLRNNLYEFGRFVRESGQEPYFTIPRLKKVIHQTLKALEFVHSLKLIHCDIKVRAHDELIPSILPYSLPSHLTLTLLSLIPPTLPYEFPPSSPVHHIHLIPPFTSPRPPLSLLPHPSVHLSSPLSLSPFSPLAREHSY
jgi:serine/threonine protein kinase